MRGYNLMRGYNQLSCCSFVLWSFIPKVQFLKSLRETHFTSFLLWNTPSTTQSNSHTISPGGLHACLIALHSA